MGWICSKCGTENDFSRQFCMACRFEPDEAFLRKEQKAANREKAAFLNVVRKKAAALTRDYRCLRRILFWLNAAAVTAVLVFFVMSALSSGLFTSSSAERLLAGDVSGHSGIQTFLMHGSEHLRQLDTSLVQLDRIGRTRFTALKSVGLPAAASDNAEAFATSMSHLRLRGSLLINHLGKGTSALSSPVDFLQELPQLLLQRFGLQ